MKIIKTLCQSMSLFVVFSSLMSCEERADPSYTQEYMLLKEQAATDKALKQGLERDVERYRSEVTEKEIIIAEQKTKLVTLEGKLRNGSGKIAKPDGSKVLAGLISKMPNLRQKVLTSNPGASIVKDAQLGMGSIDLDYPLTAPFEYILRQKDGRKISQVWVARGSLEGDWKFEMGGEGRVAAVEDDSAKPDPKPDPDPKPAVDQWPPVLAAPWGLTRNDDTFAVFLNSETGQYKIMQRQ